LPWFYSSLSLTTKVVYSAALTMLNRAEMDLEYFATAAAAPFKHMKNVLFDHNIYTEIPQGYFEQQLAHAVRSR
jgi:hypothetical protein